MMTLFQQKALVAGLLLSLLCSPLFAGAHGHCKLECYSEQQQKLCLEVFKRNPKNSITWYCSFWKRDNWWETRQNCMQFGGQLCKGSLVQDGEWTEEVRGTFKPEWKSWDDED